MSLTATQRKLIEQVPLTFIRIKNLTFIFECPRCVTISHFHQHKLTYYDCGECPFCHYGGEPIMSLDEIEDNIKSDDDDKIVNGICAIFEKIYKRTAIR